MILDFAQLAPAQRYFAMVQAIIPRPIAWVLTDNGGNTKMPTTKSPSFNLAPFSFFTGICSDPPLLMLSIGKKPAGEEAGEDKDTRKNIQERKYFVVHIAHTAQLDALNQSAETLLHGQSELDHLGLQTVPFAEFPLPRIEHCTVALGCSLYRIDEIGNAPQAVIYGKVEAMYVDDSLITPHASRLVIDPQKLDPLSRLGGNDYASLGELMHATRPK